MREIEQLGDIPPRVVGDNATREQGIQEGDAAVLLRAYPLGHCVPVGVADGFEKPVDQVPEVVATSAKACRSCSPATATTSRRTSHSAANRSGRRAAGTGCSAEYAGHEGLYGQAHRRSADDVERQM